MVLFIYVSLILANLFIGLRRYFHPFNKSKNRLNVIIFILSFIGFCILLIGYRNFSGLSNDLLNNQAEYNSFLNYRESGYEIIYRWLMGLGRINQLDFYTWRATVLFAGLLLHFFCIYKWLPNPHLYLSFFSMFYLIQSAELYRNFIAFVIFFTGGTIYLYSKVKHKNITFGIFILIAGFIHSSYLLYFIFLIFNRKVSQKTINMLISIVLLFCVFIFINGNKIPGLTLITSFLGDSRLMNYFDAPTRFGFIIFFLLHFSSLFLFRYMEKYGIKSEAIMLTKKMTLVTMLFFPLYMIDGTFIRIGRNLLPFLYGVQGEYILDKSSDRKKIIYLVFTFLAVSFWMYDRFFISSRPEVLFYPFFTDNIFFNPQF